MYDRRVAGRVVTFGHSGILYKFSFVLYDRQTESLWVQANGMAEHGPMKGNRLRLFPSTVTSWGRWKKAYPHTEVMPGQRSGVLMGTFHGMGNSYFEMGLVVQIRFKGKLYPYEELDKEPIVNDHFNGVDLLVVRSIKDGSVIAWNRKLNGRVLEFTLRPMPGNKDEFLIYDRQTETMWNWVTGKAVTGPLQGKQLSRLQTNPMLVDRFDGFYPNSPVFHSDIPGGDSDYSYSGD